MGSGCKVLLYLPKMETVINLSEHRLSFVCVMSIIMQLSNYLILLGISGSPEVGVDATKQVISADSTEPLPILTCSAMEDGRLPVNKLTWTKDGKVLAESLDGSGPLVFDISTSLDSPFGEYTCEATTSQNKASNSTLIAERGTVYIAISCHSVIHRLSHLTCITLLNHSQL